MEPEPEAAQVEPEAETAKIPKLVFIVPYRDREEHLSKFKSHMKYIFEDIPQCEYEIFYIHQNDNRTFNRGAMKNIGFLFVRKKYPNHYKTITLVFNDVDTMPANKETFDYHTHIGIVKHFYGQKFALGGIVSINAGDFEKTNGFPNYWAWGYEDNALLHRVINSKLNIDRSQFLLLLNKAVIHLNDTFERVVNKNEFDRYVQEYKFMNSNDGISTISNLSYEEDKSTNFVHVNGFTTAVSETPEMNKIHDLRNGSIPFKNVVGRRNRGTIGLLFH